MQRSFKVSKKAFKDPWRQLVVSFCLFLFPVFLFAAIADEVREQDTLGFDEYILLSINQLASPLLDTLVVAVTQLGGPIGVVVIAAGAAAILWLKRHRLAALQLAIGVGGAGLINLLLKTVFQRDRPELWERVVTENSYSFPSGHAMASSAIALSMIAIFWNTKWRWWVVAGALIYMVGIGLTRLYLGVHYPTDIAAGWLVSGAWVVIVATVIRYHKRIFQFFVSRES